MPQSIEIPPDGLAAALEKAFHRKAVLKESVPIDHRSILKPLWNGTVHVYKLSGKTWPTRLYVFRFPTNEGQQRWLVRKHGPKNYPTPLDAVKSALREKWSGELSLSDVP